MEIVYASINSFKKFCESCAGSSIRRFIILITVLNDYISTVLIKLKAFSNMKLGLQITKFKTAICRRMVTSNN